MFKDLKKKVNIMSKQMENLNREMEIIKNLPNGNSSIRNETLKFTG